MEQQEHPAWELGLSLFLIVCGIATWILSASFPQLEDGAPGPALFPRLIGAGMILGGAVLSISALKDLRSAHGSLPFLDSRLGLLKVFAAVGIAAMVPLLMPYITLVGGIALAAALFALLIGTDLPRSIGVGLFTALVVYGVFGKLLGVPLS
ncbi:tripartite tricarboxylate transporter TctB family protein [Deinococcus deserti]|uniref:DUF1468 domain-containing protein n=1 Tax=Deinococcus deserti (strain DSM 17065 / CIP 109153 / LMG 22923 / VCD115) TaxID=546414 RepID=C1D2E7_DEIDV|nr:tripartite tricarboxylate transporter TctB family protein [Deinococcus deserti]ACO47586.1 Hypothetical protein; putative membrane protein [Deinococcus deserti VCD115]